MTPRFVAEAERLVDHKARARQHGMAERTTVQNVMETIAPPEQLTWSRTLCWAFSSVGPDGLPKAAIYRTVGEVRGLYEDFMGTEEVGGQQTPAMDIRGSWYLFGETHATSLRNRRTGVVRIVDSIVVILLDGGTGISAEMCWFRVGNVSLGRTDVAQRWIAVLTALREANVSALTALMAPSVQGAVRDYFAPESPFVLIDGRDAMRAYYERLFESVEVLDITPVRCATTEWYVFAELKWTVRLRTGPERGREVRFLTAEEMPLDADGLVQARFGYGTEME